MGLWRLATFSLKMFFKNLCESKSNGILDEADECLNEEHRESHYGHAEIFGEGDC